MPTVTIGFVARERFSKAASCLERLFDCTALPFRLVIVDGNIPRRYRDEMEKVLQGRSNVQVIRKDHYLLPNRARNLVIQHCDDEYLCLIENDVLVREGWLSRLLTVCEDYPADVAAPVLLEPGEDQTDHFHGDPRLGQVEEWLEDGRVRRRILPGQPPGPPGATHVPIQFPESHCLLFRRAVLARIGPLDEELTSRDFIDLCLQLHHARAVVVLDTGCRVTVQPPPPVEAEERDFSLFRWDTRRANWSHHRIQQRWNLEELPSALGFAIERLGIALGAVDRPHRILDRM